MPPSAPAGIWLRLKRAKPGERYILGGENLTLKQILDKLAAITGLPSPRVKVPYVMALATGVVDEVFTGRILGREPRATIDAVRMGRKKMFVSSAKAERELGWKIVPVEGALRRAVEWFQSNGYVFEWQQRLRERDWPRITESRLWRRWKEKLHRSFEAGIYQSGNMTAASSGSLKTTGVVLVCGGIGGESARRATEAVIALYQPDQCASVGLAGALDPKLKVGMIFSPRWVVDARDGSRTHTARGDGALVSCR